MKLSPFKLEEYFARYEFAAPYTMGSSDPETFSLTELLDLADEKSLALWRDLKLHYTQTQGLPLLRDEISKLYHTQSKENILVFSGAEEAIYITMQAMLKPGDHVVVLTPCYQSLKEIAKAIGAKVIEVGLEWKQSEWHFNFEKFSAAINAHTKLVVINFPHNPTGFLPEQHVFENIIQLVKRHHIYLFSDEVYRLSEQNSAECLPNAVDYYDRALSLGVMSKSFGLAGLRIGWIATRNKNLLQTLASYKNYTTICNSAPSEILAVIALKNKEHILQRNLTIARKNLDLLDDFFKRYPTVYEWYRPRAGFANFPRLKLMMPIDEFAEKLIAEEGVIILPGTLYDMKHNHFRLGFGRKNLAEALEKLDHFTQYIMSRS